MKSIVKTAKSVDEAVHLALVELRRELDEVDIEILKESKPGFLGFGSRDAVVRVTLRNETAVPGVSEKTTESDVIETDASMPESAISIAKESVHLSDTSVTAENTSVEAPVASSEEESKSTEMPEEEPKKNREEIAPVAENEDVIQESQHVEEFAADWLLSVLEQMHIDAQVSGDRNGNTLFLEISDLSDEDTGIVIGRRAETLNALQYLLAIAINRQCREHLRVLIDVGGYRGRRKTSIENMARRTAEKVQRFRRSIALEPMNAYERRIVHFALQDMENVETVSEGRDPYRKVVIRYTK